jgi:reactive intermediate/imine deaminase
MSKEIVKTSNAPAAIGAYSQAVKVSGIGETIYISGQIPLDPDSMSVVSEDFETQTRQVFTNLNAIIKATGGSIENIVKLNVYLTDLSNFSILNEVMQELFNEPYPARAAVQVSALPKQVQIEIDAVLFID